MRLADFITKHRPCEEGVAFLRQQQTAGAAWTACRNPDWMLWAIDRLEIGTPRLWRLFACWCVRNTPLADGRKVWDLLTDPRSRNAVEVAERFADGAATDAELAAAGDAARAAAVAAAGTAAWDAARAAAGAA